MLHVYVTSKCHKPECSNRPHCEGHCLSDQILVKSVREARIVARNVATMSRVENTVIVKNHCSDEYSYIAAYENTPEGVIETNFEPGYQCLPPLKA
jgi:hypothetical protein